MDERISIQWGRDNQPLAGWPNRGQWFTETLADAFAVVARNMVTDEELSQPGTGASIHDIALDLAIADAAVLANDDETEWMFIVQTPKGRYGTNRQRMAAAIIRASTD